MQKIEEERKKLLKNSSGKKTPKKPSSDYITRNIKIGPSQQSESTFADDEMLEDGFDAETAEQTTRMSARQESLYISEIDEVYEEVYNNDEDKDGDEGE